MREMRDTVEGVAKALHQHKATASRFGHLVLRQQFRVILLQLGQIQGLRVLGLLPTHGTCLEPGNARITHGLLQRLL